MSMLNEWLFSVALGDDPNKVCCDFLTHLPKASYGIKGMQFNFVQAECEKVITSLKHAFDVGGDEICVHTLVDTNGKKWYYNDKDSSISIMLPKDCAVHEDMYNEMKAGKKFHVALHEMEQRGLYPLGYSLQSYYCNLGFWLEDPYNNMPIGEDPERCKEFKSMIESEFLKATGKDIKELYAEEVSA